LCTADLQIVTNYHVLQSALAKFGASPNAPLSSSAPNPAVGKKVALVTIQVRLRCWVLCAQISRLMFTCYTVEHVSW
jgi:hypothetical protein